MRERSVWDLAHVSRFAFHDRACISTRYSPAETNPSPKNAWRSRQSCVATRQPISSSPSALTCSTAAAMRDAASSRRDPSTLRFHSGQASLRMGLKRSCLREPDPTRASYLQGVPPTPPSPPRLAADRRGWLEKRKGRETCCFTPVKSRLYERVQALITTLLCRT